MPIEPTLEQILTLEATIELQKRLELAHMANVRRWRDLSTELSNKLADRDKTIERIAAELSGIDETDLTHAEKRILKILAEKS